MAVSMATGDKCSQFATLLGYHAAQHNNGQVMLMRVHDTNHIKIKMHHLKSAKSCVNVLYL